MVTQKQWKKQSKILIRTDPREKGQGGANPWRRKLSTRLSCTPVKTADYQRLKTNIQTNFLAAVPITNLSKRKVFRARRFKSYRFGQKATVKAVKKLIGKGADPSKTVIGWGHWEQQDGGFLRGNEKAPVKKLRRACREFGIKVIKIDEHLTSKRCSGCCSSNHKCKNVKYNGIHCHQVIRCTNSECEEVWQRDLNAARNIRNVLMAFLDTQQRPEYLRPGTR
jgi:hypothetical protein